jgi:CheY-like chemotaxis protein
MSDPMSRLPPEHPARKHKRVLLVGSDTNIQDSITTLLNTMGWACTAVSSMDDVRTAIQQGKFNAILLDLRRSSAGVERASLDIKEIRPSLSERIVALISGSVDSETLEVIERYDLVQLSQENILSRLWNTLEDLVDYPAWRIDAPPSIQTARLLFDSYRMSTPYGVRSADASGRHFTYEHNNTKIDVLVDVQPASNRISLVGQVLDPTRTKARSDNLPVVLTSPTGALARTTTNRLGEFSLQFEFAENVSLEVRVGERSWISVPLTQMDWMKERMLRRPTGT